MTLHLFYHLGRRQARAARRALAIGADVACLTVDPELAETFAGRVRVLTPALMPQFEDVVSDEVPFDLVERFVDELLRRRPGLARRLEAYAGREQGYRYLCRWGLRTVGNLLALADLVSSEPLAAYECVEIDRCWPDSPTFAAIAPLALADSSLVAVRRRVALERIVFAAAAAGTVDERAKAALRAAQEVARLWADWLRRLRLRNAPRMERPLVIRHYGEDWGLNRGGQERLRDFDFIVDGERIRPDDVAILSEESVPAEHDRELIARGYAVLRRSTLTVGPAPFVTGVFPRLVEATRMLTQVAAAEGWWRLPVVSLLAESLVWEELGRRTRPRVFVAYNDLHPSGAARMMALRHHGCTTVAYQHSSSWRGHEEGWILSYPDAFSVVDVMVTWGPLHSECIRNHRASIGECWEVGCLWSEHARIVREDAAEIGARYRRLLADEYRLDLGAYEAVVGVFDTSTAPPISYPSDIVAFYAGIADIAARLPRVLFLCKPKRPVEDLFASVPGALDVERRARALPNVVFLDELFETAAVIGFSAVTISAFQTSTGIETIGSGTPALHYDPTDRFPRTFLRRVPGFVATSPGELESLVRPLLTLDGRQEWAATLHERFGGLEGHFDGRAITRLRERLRAAMDA